ncbi:MULTISPECIES: DUF3284 domain-containing protein [Streptococcus]|uniref:DUF3284 domain-containing protein n=1 Tax=Streptococcus caledonicus TaxID=2614158 RepID=A0ABW0UFD1_9STRE|nr:DUF3284 domain-containing protein [Streptococcus sp. S784/96/1]
MEVIVSKTTHLSPETLFAVLKKSLKEDYIANTQQNLADSDVKEGLTFVKNYGKNHQNSVRVLVSSFVENHRYEALFSSNRGSQVILYELTPLGDGKTMLRLKQETIPASFVQNLNDYLMSFLFKKSLKRQLSAQLTALINAAS